MSCEFFLEPGIAKVTHTPALLIKISRYDSRSEKEAAAALTDFRSCKSS